MWKFKTKYSQILTEVVSWSLPQLFLYEARIFVSLSRQGWQDLESSLRFLFSLVFGSFPVKQDGQSSLSGYLACSSLTWQLGFLFIFTLPLPLSTVFGHWGIMPSCKRLNHCLSFLPTSLKYLFLFKPEYHLLPEWLLSLILLQDTVINFLS